MASILQTRLREVLREDLGGTYSVSAGASLSNRPIEQYQISISFGSNPERAAALSDRVFEEISKLKVDGPTEQEVSDAVEQSVRSWETSMESNSFLLGQILFKYRDDKDMRELFEADDANRALTVSQVHDAARLYLNMENYVKVVLMPEAHAPPPTRDTDRTSMRLPPPDSMCSLSGGSIASAATSDLATTRLAASSTWEFFEERNHVPLFGRPSTTGSRFRALTIALTIGGGFRRFRAESGSRIPSKFQISDQIHGPVQVCKTSTPWFKSGRRLQI